MILSIFAGALILFISNLTLTDPVMLTHSKVGILAASFLSDGMGWLILRKNGNHRLQEIQPYQEQNKSIE
jgi:hypothetical protein